MTPITTFLAERLSELNPEALAAVAIVADVKLKFARRAAAGEPVAAWVALSLMAACGYDPITLEQIPPRKLGMFNRQTLALFLNGRMRVKRYTVRNVACEAKVNPRVVQAVLECNRVNINNVVKLCAYLNIHPFEQCERVREAA